jgi:hypothetical protein
MLSFASAAYTNKKELIDTFSANLETLPDASPYPETQAWWRDNSEAWEFCRKNCQPPELAMRNYVKWLYTLPGKPVFVGYPAAYDFMFIYWYLIRYTGDSPFSHSALDIKSYAMAVLKSSFRETSKRKMPKHWFDNLPHTHIALDDAIEQGALFCNILQENIHESQANF